jgi:hypothetical protein
LYLDTKDDLDNAIRFYLRHGYKCCGRYNRNPQATMFMRKRLADVSAVTYIEHAANPGGGQSTVLIRSFQAKDAVDFRRLNVEWITHYFRLEEKDSQFLNDPGQSILLTQIPKLMAKFEAIMPHFLLKDRTSEKLAKANIRGC